jgi:hypothetical protein
MKVREITINRYSAFVLHAFVSMLFFLFLSMFVFLVWYPGELIESMGGKYMLKIIFMVDITLGPLLTLIIFNPKKKSLKLDMCIIFLCQIIFMLYGAWSIFISRPAYIVFDENHFSVVAANEIDTKDLQEAGLDQFKKIPLLGPILVGSKMPDDEKIRGEILFARLGGMGIENLPKYFILYEDEINKVKSKARKKADLVNISTEDKKKIDDYSMLIENKGKELLYIPLKIKDKKFQASIDPETGKIISII